MLTGDHVISTHSLTNRLEMMSKDVEKGIVDIKRRVPETEDSATTSLCVEEIQSVSAESPASGTLTDHIFFK